VERSNLVQPEWLWFLRPSCLAPPRLLSQYTAKSSDSSSIEPSPSRNHLFDCFVLFELEVLRARLKCWAGDLVRYMDTV